MAISDLDYTDDSDVALIRRTRTGDSDAYALLHQRHVGSARALAWRMSRSSSDADDLVSEGFARVLAALQRGGGPDTAFRPYLLSTIRRLAYDRTTRERREAPLKPEVEEGPVLEDPVMADFERTTAAAAFASLPERWRMVLWHTEVEGESPAEVAVLLGMKPNAVAALAYRAREGLRQAYLSHHAGPEHQLSSECRHTADRLAAHVRGGLAPAQEQRVAAHLDHCDRCQAAYLELATVNTSMRSLLAPIVLGPAAATLYLAELAAPTVAATAGAAGAGGAVGAAVGGRAAARGIRKALGTPARSAVAAGVAAVVAVSIGLLAARGAPSQEVAAAPTTIASGRSAVPGTGEPVVPEPEPTVLAAEVESPATVSPVTDLPGASTDPVPDLAPGAAAAPAAPVAPAPGLPVPPAAPAPPAQPIPTSTVPSSTTSVPSATTSTVAPTTTTTTTTPTTTVPPPPSKLQVRLSSAGNVVAGRPGVLVAAISNPGEGDGRAVRLRVDLEGLLLRGLPRPSSAVGTAEAPGWSCTADGPSALTCATEAVAAGASSTIYVPVLAPGEVHQAALSATVTGSDDAAEPGATAALDIAVRPTGMAARFATVEHGDVVAVGNSLVTCPDDSAGCLEARQGQGDRLDNGNHAVVEVDTDADPSTTNSSSAVSTCGAGAAVLSASLYWGGDLSPGPGGQPPADPSAAGRAVVVAPGGSRAEVVAERVDRADSRYQAVADVTELVAGGGPGSWTVGGVQLATGENAYGGWALVVACADASAPSRSLVVLDGLTEVRSGAAIALEVGGFTVPAAGGGAATATTVTYEGDLGLEGDQLSVAGRAVADALNPLGNSFNSTASRLGLPASGSVPGHPNLFGFDVDRFDVTGSLPAGATSTTLELSTAADVYLPGVVAFAVDQ